MFNPDKYWANIKSFAEVDYTQQMVHIRCDNLDRILKVAYEDGRNADVVKTTFKDDKNAKR